MTPKQLAGRTGDGVRTFHAVPFAAPPVGDLRWRAPRPPLPWNGVRDATTPAPAPVQSANPWRPPVASSEDCLYLSVWTPVEPGPWPVLVWLYGGGFEGGTAVARVSDPVRLVREQRMVVVAPNYRVGALGFAELAQHGGRFAEASNLGLRDVIAALEWTAHRIADFGGDPSQVTVLGQSAGAFLAAALTAAPSAQGLFHRLAMFSGGASRVLPRAVAGALGDDFIGALREASGLPSGTGPDAVADAPLPPILTAQETLPAADIGARNGPAPRAFGVVLDGAVLTRHPMDAAVTAGQVPMLIGTSTHEVAGLRGPEPFADGGFDGLRAEVRSWSVVPDRAGEIVAHYATDRSPEAAREALLTDFIYRLPAMRLAAARPAGRTWACSFGFLPCLGRAGHGMELPLLFGSSEHPEVLSSYRFPGEFADQRRELSLALREHLGAFARSGDPGWAATGTGTTVTGLLVADDALQPDVELSSGLLNRWADVDRP